MEGIARAERREAPQSYFLQIGDFWPLFCEGKWPLYGRKMTLDMALT